MNNNNTTNIQESKICSLCMTFYANPKLGNFCSKCYNDNKANKIANKDLKSEPTVIKDEKLVLSETKQENAPIKTEDTTLTKEEPVKEEKTRPKQVIDLRL